MSPDAGPGAGQGPAGGLEVAGVPPAPAWCRDGTASCTHCPCSAGAISQGKVGDGPRFGATNAVPAPPAPRVLGQCQPNQRTPR